jgi:hypothetical protein
LLTDLLPTTDLLPSPDLLPKTEGCMYKPLLSYDRSLIGEVYEDSMPSEYDKMYRGDPYGIDRKGG